MLGGNIVHNASFENGTRTGWIDYGATAVVSIDSSGNAASGTKCLKVVSPGGTGAVDGVWYQAVDTVYEPGQEVTLSAYLKGPAGQTPSIFLMTLDDSGVFNSLSIVVQQPFNGQYQRISGKVTHTARFRPAMLITGHYEQAYTMYIDDVQIEPGPLTPFMLHKADRAQGDMITKTNQYEFNNMLSGRQTPLVMTDVEGLLSTPELYEIDTERQDAPGMFGQVAYPTSRIIDFDISGSFESSLRAEEARAALEKCYVLEEGVYYKFCFSRPYYPKRYVWAQARRRDFVSNYEVAHGLLTGSVRLFCVDPRIYSLAELTQPLTIANLATSGSLTMHNTGNYKAPVTITIPGPATNPVITNTRNGRAIRLDVVLTGANTLVIDTKLQTVKINGLDAFGYLSNDNQWWSLLPGDNVVTFNRDNAAAQLNITMAHRDVWM